MELIAGYYQFSDPKYIYIRSGLPEVEQKEVALHESYHRQLTGATVYGSIFQTLDHFLASCEQALESEPRNVLTALGNDMFQSMNFVQEGGAICQAWGAQPLIYRASSQDEQNRINDQYLDRLAPSYREIAFDYSELLFRLLSAGGNPISDIVFSYTNQTLGLFLMNPGSLEQSQTVSFDDDSILRRPEVLPDSRFRLAKERLRGRASCVLFREQLQQSLDQEFGCKDSTTPAGRTSLMEAIEADRDHFEHRMHNSIHKALDAVLPAFAISLQDYSAYVIAANWRKTMSDFFSGLVPTYSPMLVQYMFTAEEKETAFLEHTKHFD